MITWVNCIIEGALYHCNGEFIGQYGLNEVDLNSGNTPVVRYGN